MKPLALALLALAGVAGTADAEKKRTFCQKAIAREHGKLVAKKGGVTV